MLDHDKMVKQAMKLPIVSACSECRYVVKKEFNLENPIFWQCGVTCTYASFRNRDGKCRDFEPAEIKSRDFEPAEIKSKKLSRGLGLGAVWIFVGAFTLALTMILLFNL